MKFECALKAMREGKKVRQKSWWDWELFWIENEELKCFANHHLDIEILEELSTDFLFATDWEIVDERI